jgi:uncharacterized membrane protein
MICWLEHRWNFCVLYHCAWVYTYLYHSYAGADGEAFPKHHTQYRAQKNSSSFIAIHVIANVTAIHVIAIHVISSGITEIMVRFWYYAGNQVIKRQFQYPLLGWLVKSVLISLLSGKTISKL